MRYHVWTYQDGQGPPVVRLAQGRPAFPGSLPQAHSTPGRASAKEEVEGLMAAVDRIMQIMKGNGLSDETQTVIVRGKATEALRDHGAYRTALPAQGRWVLAETVK
jgi:hypothetical protein